MKNTTQNNTGKHLYKFEFPLHEDAFTQGTVSVAKWCKRQLCLKNTKKFSIILNYLLCKKDAALR